jgi:acetolactate synthase I/II/III large subunit
MTTAADAVITTLAEAGVSKIFGVVGTSTLDLVDAIGREPRLEYVSARTEEGAAHMADGYARATGRVGVVLCHVGPGAVRQMYGIGTAYKDSVPLVAMTGNEVLRATDTQMREGYHVVDVLDLYRPLTKATLQLREGRDARAVTTRALWLATSGRPGPVLLDLPKSALKEPFEGPASTLGTVSDRVPASRPVPDPADLERVAELLQGARRPVVLAGGGVHFSRAHEALEALATTRNLPVLTTDGGRGGIAEDHPQALGVIARQAGDRVARDLLADADVVLALGTPFSDVSTFEWSAWSDDATVIQVDISPEAAHKGAPVHLQLVADIRAALSALDEALDARGWRFTGSWSDERSRLTEERAAYHALAGQRGEQGLVNPWTLIAELETSLPRDAFVSVDSGMHSFYGKKLRVLAPRTYIRSAGFGAMGYSFPALLGALEGLPERRAVAIIGDGCLQMCLGEFETAARRNSPLTVVVCNDQRFASQQSHQHRRFDGRVVGTDFHPTDFAAVAAAQGVRGWVVEDDEAARAAIREALAHDGPTVVDARLDRSIQPATWIEGSGDQRIGATSTA